MFELYLALLDLVVEDVVQCSIVGQTSLVPRPSPALRFRLLVVHKYRGRRLGVETGVGEGWGMKPRSD